MKAPRLLIGLLAAATLIQTAGASGAFVTGSGDSSPASGIFQSSGAGAAASPLAPGRSAVKARLITAQTAAVPGKSLKLAVELTHDAGWHTYWKNPGDVGSPTESSGRFPQAGRSQVPPGLSPRKPRRFRSPITASPERPSIPSRLLSLRTPQARLSSGCTFPGSPARSSACQVTPRWKQRSR